ncbi:unnamed protein product [Cladocopium goreaui]|uniref:Uncharacterized protein n=1 Tax=Cladocopium goreaui TaxID=2562237 RepID=A0A9P1GKJ3_9DINO|nr:unnamed protein product [Cladocopium goreaui]
MVTFAIVLIFGHELPLGRSLPTCWLDRICVHQTDMDKKKEQINALPVFVAQSSKMLVLWDQTYFERLWCNLELATCARYGGTDKIELMPLWLAPWLLSTIFLDLLSAGILEIMFHLFPNYSAAWMHDISEMSESIFGHNPAMESFVSTFAVWMFSGIAYLPVSIPSFFCFRAKLLSHQLMLEQMSTFDVRAAHCTVASDRASIEEQVTALFSGMEDKTAAPLPSAVDDGEVVLQRFEPLQEDPLVRFNAFIRGNLREFVISQIGDELSVPYHICLVAFLPMIFYSSVNVLGCDNGPCASSAKLESYRSVSAYMITQTVGWFLVLVLASPLTYPLLLRMITFVLSFGDGPLQLLLAFLCCPLAYIYMYVCGGIWWGSLVALMTREPSAIQLLVFLLVLAVLIMQLLWLFQNPSRRRTESCRCVKRQTYEALAHVQSGE